MAGIKETVVEGARLEAKKEWAAPELKKTSIEQITANGSSSIASDGHPNMS